MWPLRHYSPIPTVESRDTFEKDRLPYERAQNRRSILLRLVIVGLAAVLLCTGGFWAGITTARYQDRPLSLPGTVPRVPLAQWSRQKVQNNASFEAAPPISGGSEKVWDFLIPNGLGHVIHPELAPQFSVVSVFHQLHCLYFLRRAYYSSSLADQQDFDLGVERKPHSAHCFDYLRQSIMCSADSSLEPSGDKVVVNPDWGFDRQCRSFDDIKAWAEQWRVFDANGFMPSEVLGSLGEGISR